MLDKVSRAEGERDWQRIDADLVRFIKWKQGTEMPGQRTKETKDICGGREP
jgi:hypothetical protein